MIWKNFKNSIINLGFEETDVFDENVKHLIEAANRSLNYISTIVERKKKVIHIDVPSNSEYYAVDLTGYEDYSSAALNIPPKIKGNPIGDYYYEEDVLFVNAPGENISITYNAIPEFIPYDVDDGYNIDLKKELCPILELMTAHYMWLDDDEPKALYYYNRAQEKTNMYLSRKAQELKETTIATVMGGIDI